MNLRFIGTGVAVGFLFLLQSLPAYRLTSTTVPVGWMRTQADLACIICVYLALRETDFLRGALASFVVGLFASAFAPSDMQIQLLLSITCYIVTYVFTVAFYFPSLTHSLVLLFAVSVFHSYAHLFLITKLSVQQDIE